MATKKSGQEYNVTALRKSIAVLGVIKDSSEPLGVSEIARRADVSKNMCLRILETLTDLGWVDQHAASPVYELTLAPFQFFANSRNRTTLLDQALPALKALNRKTGESTYLCVPYQNKALMIHVIKGVKPISVTGEIGASYDLHATAPGKVFLAWDEATEPSLKRKLKVYTDKTITGGKALRAELNTIRARGYALNKEEYGPGLLGMAAPVFNEDREVIAAVGIFAPTTNIAPEDFEPSYAKAVCEAARAASS
jgi:DNA-binding IclR family transcriptional regulator